MGRSQSDELEQLLTLALRTGATAAEVAQERSFSQPVVFEANRLKQLETSDDTVTALRVWRQGRPGVAVAGGPIDSQILVEKALGLSELGEVEEPLLTDGGLEVFASVGNWVPVDRLIEWGEAAIATIRSAYDEVLCEASLTCETNHTRLINSLGLDYRYEETTISGGLSAEWVRGDDLLAVEADGIDRTQLDPQGMAASVIERLGWAEHTAAPATGQLPVVLMAQATDLLWGTVQAALNGRRWVEGASPWQQGQAVATHALTIGQHPDRGPYSCPFDDEGTRTQVLPLIVNGEVVQAYCDRTTGQRLGTSSTGNGFRAGLGSRTMPGLVNFWVEPGEKALAELLKELPEAVIVDQVMGGGAGLSGELSVNLELGYYLKQGEIVGRLKDTMLSGNVYQALKRAGAIAAEATWNGASYSPAIVVEGLTVIG
ncbi:MAG: TldD/PmbA family protein [Cyanobacteria bacterium J06648_16]